MRAFDSAADAAATSAFSLRSASAPSPAADVFSADFRSRPSARPVAVPAPLNPPSKVFAPAAPAARVSLDTRDLNPVITGKIET